MKKVLVTGGAGYIGRHVVNELLRRGFLVCVNDLQIDNEDPKIEYSHADIFSGDPDVYNALGRPDLLIHMAWEQGFVHDAQIHMDHLPAHKKFLKDMAEGGCREIAVMGSMHEVGLFEGAVTADTSCEPRSLYGISKNSLRKSIMAEAIRLGFSLYWLRGFYIYGDDIRGSSIFAKLMQAAAEGKTVFPFTTGQNRFDFIHIDELALQIVSVATQGLRGTEKPVTGIINVCSGKPVDLAKKVEDFIIENGLDIKLQYGAFPDRPYDNNAIWGDDTLIRSILSTDRELCEKTERNP